MNKKIKQKKALTLFLIFVMALSAVKFTGGVVKAANNWKDTSFDFYYDGDGSDRSSKAKNKMDNSMSYVKLSSKSKHKMWVAVEAKKGIKAGEYGDPIGYTYMGGGDVLKPGKFEYFHNDAHKKGYKTTYIAMSSADHGAHYYYGVWSPDNCSGR